eukprot:2309699-Pyramimonas_sp.AAC.1
MPDPTRIPPWLSQQRYGEPLPARSFVPIGNAALAGEPPSVGTWHADDTIHLWEQLPNHRESWEL